MNAHSWCTQLGAISDSMRLLGVAAKAMPSRPVRFQHRGQIELAGGVAVAAAGALEQILDQRRLVQTLTDTRGGHGLVAADDGDRGVATLRARVEAAFAQHQPVVRRAAHGGRHRAAIAAVPVLDGAVEAARYDEAVVGRERERLDRAALTAQGEAELPGGGIPDHDIAAFAAAIARRGVPLAEAGGDRLAIPPHG